MGQQKQKSPLTEDEAIIDSNLQREKVLLSHSDKMQPIIQVLANEVSLADLFDLFIEASTLRNVLAIHHRMLNYLDLNPCQFNIFFPTLKKAVLTNRVRKNWKAAAIFAKIDRRASHRCYQNNKLTNNQANNNSDHHILPDNNQSSHREQDNNNAMNGYSCLIVGAGPAGLRTAIELQLLGAKRVVIAEKRGRFSRNNVLHLWPFVIEDLKSLGAKKFYGKFCAGSIDHISIRQIQLILLKICLMIGCDFRDCCSFMGLCPASLNNADGTTNTCDIHDGHGKFETINNLDDDDDCMSEEGNAGIKNNHVVLLETRPSSVCASPIPLIDGDDDDNDDDDGDDESSDQQKTTNDDHSDKHRPTQSTNDLESEINDHKQQLLSGRLSGSNAHFKCDYPLQENELNQIKWDVIIGADGRRNTLKTFFPRKEFRGRLAIAITANFVNSQTPAEAKIPEISGISYIYNQDLFKALASDTNILLENICYYKDDTHYFVMTAQKRSLLERNVLLKDFATTNDLLSEDNINRKALLEYAKDAASWTTGLEPLNFALNHYGQEDCAMFDFTSMYAASNACKALQTKNGGLVLINLVGDSLLEPFWPTGSGCARGFLSSLDTAWMCRQWAVNKCPIMKQSRNYNNSETNNTTTTAFTNHYNIKSVLSVIAERESIYRLLAQTTSENLHQNYSHWTLNPHTRYPNLNRHLVVPSQIRNLLGYHNGISLFENPQEDAVTKSILNNLSDNNNTANSSSHHHHHRSRLISPNTLSKRSKKSKLQTNSSSSTNNNNNNKLSIKNQSRSQCRSASRSSSRQTSKTSRQQQSSILSPSPQRKQRQTSSYNHSSSSKTTTTSANKYNKSPSGYTDSLLEFELSYKNLTSNNNNIDNHHDMSGGEHEIEPPFTPPLKGCSYEEIIRDYPMPLSSLSGTTPSANNLVSLEARRARDIDECLRHRREQNSKGAEREEILKRLQPTYGKRGSANALIGAAAIYRDMMRASRQENGGNSSDDLSSGGSIRRCASFAERVKSFENKLSESYGLSSSPTAAAALAAAKDKTSHDIDDIRNLPQFATLQEMFVTNSTLNNNNDKDSTMKIKKSKMPIMKLTKEDWNVKCWEERLAKYHNRQLLYDECGNISHSAENSSPGAKGKLAATFDAASVAAARRTFTRPEKQVEVFRGRIREMADKLRRPSETTGRQQQQHNQNKPNSKNSQYEKFGSSASRSHEWVNLIKGELNGGGINNKRSDDSSSYSSSRHKRVIKKLFEDDDDENDENNSSHQHYDHLCLNKPKNKYTPVNSYTSYLSRATNNSHNRSSQLGNGGGGDCEKKYSNGNLYKDVVESNHALTKSSSSINSSSYDKIKSTKTATSSTTTTTTTTTMKTGSSSSSASSTISELSSNSSIKGSLAQHNNNDSSGGGGGGGGGDNKRQLNHSIPINCRTTTAGNSVCIRCKNSVATIDKVVIDEAIVHRSCLTCSKCDVRLRLNEVKSQKPLTITNNNNDNCKQLSGGVKSQLASTNKRLLLDEAMESMQLADGGDDSCKTVQYNFICVMCQSLRHDNGSDLNIIDTVAADAGDKIKERVKSKEEFLNQQVDYSTLYKSILEDTVGAHPINNGDLATIASSNTIVRDSSCDSSSGGAYDTDHVGERVGFELSSRRHVDEDEELDMILLRDSAEKTTSKINQDNHEEEEEQFSISSVDGDGESSDGSSGTTSDLKSISSSSYDNEDLDDNEHPDEEEEDLSEDQSLDVDEDDDDDDNDDNNNMTSCPSQDDEHDNDNDNSSFNSPPNTDAYEEEEEEEEDDRNSTYNDFLTSEEFDYSANVVTNNNNNKNIASPSHPINSAATTTSSVQSTPSKTQRSDISSDTNLKMSPLKQVIPPEIVIEYHDTT